MKSFKGKKIWIIGASSGIGEALSIELSSLGADLILSARRTDKLNQLNDDLRGLHTVLPIDVININDCISAVKSIDKIDSLIFLAATYDKKMMRDMDINTAHQIIDVNLKGALNVVHASLPLFTAQGYGQIALCGSVAGYRGLPAGQPYSATKAAIINMAESLRAEQPGLDIKIINPGFVKTPMTDKNDFEMPMAIESDEAAQSLAKGLLSRRFEIHFPKKFTFLMKVIQILSNPISFWLTKRIMS